MGFSYRKSVKMGPFRVTASKSGVSYSVGVKGARVTKRANGRVQTTLSVPGTGLRYTSTTGARKKPASRATASTTAPPSRAAPTLRPASRPTPAITPGQAPAPRQAVAARPAPVPRPALAPRQPQPATPARPPKPVRLRGTRYSAPPRIAAPWLLPFRIKGNLAIVTVHQGGIHIERTRGGRINGNRSSDIPWGQLVGIDFLEPNFFHNGHVHFATADDPRGLTATGNGNRMAAAARNPHAIMFAWHQSRDYRRLRDLVTGTAPGPPPPQQRPAYPASGAWQ
jgi:hypothetical protein